MEMPDQRLTIAGRHPAWRIVLLTLSLGVICALMYVGGDLSTSFQHLFYLTILASASFYGIPGGIIVGVVAGILSSPLLPFISVKSIPQEHIDSLVRFVSFVSVGLVTGMLTGSLRKRLHELNTLTDDSIRAFVRALDAMDGATAKHSEKVAEYATAIAEQMNLAPAQIDRVRWAALLHDVGKLSVPSDVLNKQGPLDDAEWEIIKRHPLESVRIVGNVTQLHSLLPAVRHHHERVDGRGYPDGVQGAQFPLEARIISVADAFDAMTSNRAYRAALSVQDAYDELRRNAGTQFDPKVVTAFVHFHSRKHGRNGTNGTNNGAMLHNDVRDPRRQVAT